MSMKPKASVLDYLDLRVLSCYHEAMMIKHGRIPAPRMAIFYPTYLCNHDCIGCDYTDLNKAGEVLSEKDFLRVIRELIGAGIRGIEFCGGGEPTLHKSLAKGIKLMVKHHVSFGILTNGTNLNGQLQSLLVKHGSYCRISVEAATEKTFNSYKRPRNPNAGFKKVIANIKSLVKLRGLRKDQTKLQVSFKFSVDKFNCQDAPKAVKLAARLGVDSLQYKLIRNMPSEIRDQRLVKRLKESVLRQGRRYPGLRVIPDFEKSRLKVKCWLSPLQLVVDPYGDVYICCYYRHRGGGHCLGNILKNKLKDIWFSRSHWNKLKAIDPGDCNKYDCRFHYYNELMHKLVIDDIGQLNFI